MAGTTGATGRWAGRGAEEAGAAGAAVVRGAADEAGAAAWDGTENTGAPADGPPGGKVGSLMVGAAEGLGGRLIRTVSFLGCILDASGGLGGTAPLGKLGMFSAINLFKPT
jgi:hypothetical protein